jgi:hypothetical protein
MTARPTIKTLIVGGAISIAGLAVRAWASGYLKKNQKLTMTGPYAYTRNPLYVGTFVLGSGAAIASGSWLFAAIYLVFYAAIYIPVMLAEADTMKRLFPEEYESYSRDVPLFIPRLSPYKSEKEASPQPESRFDLSQYLKHREYRAALGSAAVFVLLIVWLIVAGR